jgi:predicted dehydrogenase
MAEEHVRVLLAAGVSADGLLLVGRGRERAERLAERYGIHARWGGVETLREVPRTAIVAVPETELAGTIRVLLERGATHILVEKPGALSPRELEGVESDQVFVAYNRRFYPSVSKARDLIAEDGGVLSAAFDFTEIEERVLRDADRRGLGSAVLARWGLANSLHVIDLAFHLSGEPLAIEALRAGALPWHPSGAVFVGAGKLEGGGLFSYLATWSGAGRWGVELTTSERKLVLRPLESLAEQRRGSFELDLVELVHEPEGLKPGLVGQWRAFVAAARGGQVDPALCTLSQAHARLELAEKIFAYD